jgi:hypothetical protein
LGCDRFGTTGLRGGATSKRAKCPLHITVAMCPGMSM